VFFVSKSGLSDCRYNWKRVWVFGSGNVELKQTINEVKTVDVVKYSLSWLVRCSRL